MTYQDMSKLLKKPQVDRLLPMIQLLTEYGYAYADYGDQILTEAPLSVLQGWARNLKINKHVLCIQMEGDQCIVQQA